MYVPSIVTSLLIAAGVIILGFGLDLWRKRRKNLPLAEPNPVQSTPPLRYGGSRRIAEHESRRIQTANTKSVPDSESSPTPRTESKSDDDGGDPLTAALVTGALGGDALEAGMITAVTDSTELGIAAGLLDDDKPNDTSGSWNDN